MPGMTDTIKNAFRIPDLRKKLLFTFGMMVIYRIGIKIPVPGIDPVAFTALIDRFGQLGALLDIISGGAFKQVSIFAMGITPYINSSIIMQLLTVAIPALERLQKEGESGRKKIQQYVRYLTIGLALLQATAYWFATRTASASTLPAAINAILIIVSFTAGTAFIMWIGEQINESGIGNGISLIIFTGIVTRGPDSISTLYTYFRQITLTSNVIVSILMTLLVIVMFILTITLVVFVQMAERRIPVQYAKKVVGRKMYGGQSTYLPIKANSNGVLPLIFALTFLQFPGMIAQFKPDGAFYAFYKTYMGTSSAIYYVIYALLIIGFGFFYSSVTFNPIEMSKNLQQNGGFITGIRPGKPTSDYLGKISGRLTLFGSLFLAVVAILPQLAMRGMAESSAFGATSVLIMVNVALETTNQLESHMLMRHYKGFLN